MDKRIFSFIVSGELSRALHAQHEHTNCGRPFYIYICSHNTPWRGGWDKGLARLCNNGVQFIYIYINSIYITRQ